MPNHNRIANQRHNRGFHGMSFNRRILFLTVIGLSLSTFNPTSNAVEAEKPIRILLVTGGCCHDYDFQTQQMIKATFDAKVKCEWTVINEGGKGTTAQIDLYNDPKWADGYDVVIHNECFANTTDPAYIRKITTAHKNGANAIVIHCAMHTYRAAKIDDWREFLGVTSRRHDHQSNYPIKTVAKDHPIMKDFPTDYVSPKDELYIIENTGPETKVLATSNSEKDTKAHPVIWTNQYGKARVFGTTYGHSKETFSDSAFLKMIVRGILWSSGRLESDEK
jgi:type 1 glutamine amidotransferase